LEIRIILPLTSVSKCVGIGPFQKEVKSITLSYHPWRILVEQCCKTGSFNQLGYESSSSQDHTSFSKGHKDWVFKNGWHCFSNGVLETRFRRKGPNENFPHDNLITIPEILIKTFVSLNDTSQLACAFHDTIRFLDNLDEFSSEEEEDD
jgi:hypothetical protein